MDGDQVMNDCFMREVGVLNYHTQMTNYKTIGSMIDKIL